MNLLNSGRQIGDPFYAYVGWGGSFYLIVEGCWAGSQVDFWLLQMSSPSAFCGEHSTTAGYSTPSLLCGVHPSGGVKVCSVPAFGMNSWMTAAVLERSTLASSLLLF